MLSRREKRYQNRVKIRQLKKEKFLNNLPSFEQIFTYENLYESFWLCRKEVSWKPSIQIFQQNLNLEIIKLLKILHSDQGFKPKGFIEFNICERGKIRHIKSVNIQERVVQRCFCDNFLVPLLTHCLIYDNGASLKGKGIDFHLNRMKRHLEEYFKKYHTNEGWILLYDFSNYFGNIDHEKLYNIVDPLVKDNQCLKLFHRLIDPFGNTGLGLGSQVSQISAVVFPNMIDQKISNFYKTENYARYMDDGYCIFKTKEDAKEALKILLAETKKLNIQINSNKIQICKINKSFIFLKKRFFLNKKGKAIMRLNKNNIYKHRRRIYKLFNLIKLNKLVLFDVELSHKSWYGQVLKFKNKKSVYDINKQIRRLLNECSS